VAAATYDTQKVVRARVADIARVGAEAGIEAPVTLVVGEVVEAIPATEVVRLAEPAFGDQEVWR
jgi:siroheme synthase